MNFFFFKILNKVTIVLIENMKMTLKIDLKVQSCKKVFFFLVELSKEKKEESSHNIPLKGF